MGLNKKQITTFINYPEEISADEVKKLSSLIKEYPYFQTARLLYSRGLKNIESADFDAMLQLTATYASDRKKLYGLLFGDSEMTDSPVVAQPTLMEQQIVEKQQVVEEVQHVAEEVVEEVKAEPIQEETPKVEEPVSAQVNEVQHVAEEVVEEVKAEPIQEETPKVEEPVSAQVEEVQQVAEEVLEEVKAEPIEEETPKVEEPVSAQEEEVQHVAEEVVEEVKAEPIQEETPKVEEPVSTQDEEVQQVAEEIIEEVKVETIQEETPKAEEQKEKTFTSVFSKPIIKAVIDDAPKNESLAERILRECRERKEREQANVQERSQPETTETQTEAAQSASDSDMLLDFTFSGEVKNEQQAAPSESEPLCFEMLDEEPSAPKQVHDWYERNGGRKNKSSDFDLIDKFIQDDPKMPQFSPDELPEGLEVVENMVKESSEEHECVTESMAKICIKQKLFDKAIEIYEKLSLKYPEKSVYFANRISEVNELKK
ncbi:MAG: hypothetical protein IK117_03970 [Bacteroidales bacterium]|nr:hypothetical protein [Bacteroidales bacterium]